MPDVKDFLNPNSTLTPGIAGSVAMVAGNSLWVGFGLPQAWTALAVSFLFAILLVAAAKAPLWQRGIYVVLNCLVIFSVGLGANGVGTRAASGSALQPRSDLQQFVIVGSAEAAQPQNSPATAEEVKRLQDDLKRKNEEVRRLEEALRKSEQQKPSPTQQQSPAGGQRKFFERWKF